MALDPTLSNVAANAAVDAVTVLCNSGYINIYDGTKAANADTAIGAQVLLAQTRFGATAFGAAAAGTATANAITSDTSANNTGTATWFRVLKADASTVVFDGTAGTSLSDLNLNSASIVMGALVSISSFSYSQPKT